MELKPQPVRRLPLDPAVQGEPAPAAPPAFSARGRRAPAPTLAVERMRIEDLSIAYGAKPAVRDVSLPVRQGEVLALIGPSGCGKTTLLRSLNRLTELTRTASSTGRITLDGADIADFDPTALRRRVTMVFQQPNPFPMSVYENIAYVLREQAARRPRCRRACARCSPMPACSTRWHTTSAIRRCGSRAGSSSGSASPARWPSRPRCSCSTSRARRSTRSRRR